MKNIPTYNVVLSDEEDGVTLISLVKSPANQREFIKMGSQQAYTFAENKMKQELTGPVLIPNQLIYRRDANGTEYNLNFTAEIISDIRRGFHASTGNLKMTNIEHNADVTCPGVVLNSQLLTNDNRAEYDKLGYADLPNGTWMVTYYIPNATDWNKYVMSGQVKGFSIEAYLDKVIKLHQLQKISLEAMLDAILAAEEISEELLDKLLNSLDDVDE